MFAMPIIAISLSEVINQLTVYSSWLERKLFLKVNATKTKVVRPTKSNFLVLPSGKLASTGKQSQVTTVSPNACH